MGQGECNCACPVGSGPKKTLADISGTYEASKMRCCKAKICGCPAKNCDFGCVCFFCGPVPFSGTPLCMAGDNVWANYQGYCIAGREDGTIIQNYLGGRERLDKVAPVAASMERPQTLAPPPPPPPDPASAERPIHTIIRGIEGSEIVVNLDSSARPMNIHGVGASFHFMGGFEGSSEVNRPPSGDQDSTLQFL